MKETNTRRVIYAVTDWDEWKEEREEQQIDRYMQTDKMLLLLH